MFGTYISAILGTDERWIMTISWHPRNSIHSLVTFTLADRKTIPLCERCGLIGLDSDDAYMLANPEVAMHQGVVPPVQNCTSQFGLTSFEFVVLDFNQTSLGSFL